MNQQKTDLIRLVLIVLVTKVIFFVFSYSVLNINDMFTQAHSINFSYPQDEPLNYLTALKNWDGQHYTFLATSWYQPDQSSNAFFPLYPLTIKITSYLFDNTIISSLIVSNLCSVVAFVFLFLIIKKIFSRKTAWLTTILLLLFPTSFYFNIAYTESIFFMLSILSVYYALKNRFALACLFAMFLALTKLTGLLIIIPLFIIYLDQNHLSLKGLSKHLKDNKQLFYLILPLVSFGAYLINMKYFTLNYFSGFASQNDFISQRSFFNIKQIGSTFQSIFIHSNKDIYYHSSSIIDKMCFFLFLLSLIIKIKIPSWMRWYLVTFATIPLLSGSLMSYARYILIVFPMFVIFSLALRKLKPINQIFIFLLSFALQLILITRFINFLWVA